MPSRYEYILVMLYESSDFFMYAQSQNKHTTFNIQRTILVGMAEKSGRDLAAEKECGSAGGGQWANCYAQGHPMQPTARCHICRDKDMTEAL